MIDNLAGAAGSREQGARVESARSLHTLPM